MNPDHCDLDKSLDKSSKQKQSFFKNPVFARRKGLLLAIPLALIVLLLPTPGPTDFFGQAVELTRAGQNALALLVFLVVVFITEALPIGAALAVIYGWIVLGGIIPAKEAGKIFGSDATWFLVGALMLSEILIKYDIHKRFLILILKVAGGKTWRLVFGIALGAAILSAFISDSAVVSFLLPVLIAIIIVSGGMEKCPNLGKCLLFAAAYGAALGGLATPSGGGRNVIMMSLLENNFGITVGFGAWALMAFPITLLTVLFMTFWLLKRFKPEFKDISGPVGEIKKELSKNPMSFKEWLVVGIYGATILAFVLAGETGLGMIALVSVLIFLGVGLARWSDVEKINWGIILLYFGAIGLGTALQQSGAATWLAAQIVSIGGLIMPFNTLSVTALSSIFMTLFTETMSDGPAVASIGPVLLEVARFVNADPIIVGVATAIASSFAFVLIIATPANAIIYSSGFLKAKDFVKAGAGVAIICLIILLLVVKFWWIDILGVGIAGFH